MAALSLFLALVLATSAGHKLLARDRLALATAKLAGVPQALGFPLLLVAAACEVLAALALMVPAMPAAGALGAAAIWLSYGVALARRYGQRLDCGCDLSAREKPVDGLAIARPVILAMLAAALAVSPATAWTADAPFAALALLALWFAAGELAQLPAAARLSQRNPT